jgi:hypothetical protein
MFGACAAWRFTRTSCATQPFIAPNPVAKTTRSAGSSLPLLKRTERSLSARSSMPLRTLISPAAMRSEAPTRAARDPGLEGEPRFDHAVRLPGILDNRPGGGRRRGEGRLEHPYDRFVPLHRLDVPGEGQGVAPIAFAAKEGDSGADIGRRESVSEA